MASSILIVVIDVEAASTVVHEPQSSEQETGHLLAGYEIVAAIAVVGGRVAALCYSCDLEPISCAPKLDLPPGVSLTRSPFDRSQIRYGWVPW
jgi:hypothetical protein